MSLNFEAPTLLVFDLDDTLYEYQACNEAGSSALVCLGAAETGLSEADFKKAIDEARSVVKGRLGKTGSSHSRLLYIHEALEQLGFSNQSSLSLELEQEFWREYLLRMELRPGAEELLLSARFSHIPIALVTDLTLQIQLRKLILLGIDSFFDIVVASEETNGDKSSLEPFKAMAGRSQSEWLQNVWFVGDGPHDGPVLELQELKIIQAGHSWSLNGKSNQNTTAWSALSQVENALTKAAERN
jgi:FMN phosphatase YigB (HAD superfamily)